MKKLFLGILLMLVGFAFAQKGKAFVICAETFGFFVQVKSNHPHMMKESEDFNAVLGPVETGSAFKICYEFPSKVEKDFELRSVIFENSKSLLQQDYDFVVVPNERNICYIVEGNGIEKFIEKHTMPVLLKSSIVKGRLKKPIKKALKEYKGTEWEPCLNAEMEVWE